MTSNTDSDDLDISDFISNFKGFDDIEAKKDDIEVSDEQPEVIFFLDDIPGAPDAEDIVVLEEGDEGEVEIEAGSEDSDEADPWKWEPAGFLSWLQDKFDNVPSHSGYDTTGLEKAISYFELLDKEITKAMRNDFKNEIDSAEAEKAREQIEEGLERLVDRLQKVKTDKYKRHAKKSKTSWAEEAGLIKEAKSTKISGITITVPLLISRCARVCVNGSISAGHDLEEIFASQVKEYKLDNREQAELSQLLEDMGYPIIQDRGYAVGEEVNIYKSDNFDWAANYKA